MSQRKQQVAINGCASNWTSVFSSVLPGCILGPLLFALYIKDLPHNQIPALKCLLMTLLYITVSSKNKIILTWSQPLWCKSWQMTLNPSKCEVLCISNKCPPPLFQCAYDENVIKWTNAVHYLVVTFNTRLHWNHHCKSVASKATRSFNVLHRIMLGHSKKAPLGNLLNSSFITSKALFKKPFIYRLVIS